MVDFPLKPIFVEDVLLFRLFYVPANHFKKTSSTPSHLIHFLIKGSYDLKIQQREYQVGEGELIYYDDSEEVIWMGNENPVEFYSVAFVSQYLQPLPLDKRVFKANKKIINLFHLIHEYTKKENLQNNFFIFNKISELVYEIFKDQKSSVLTADKNRWHEVEKYLQRNHFYSIQLNQIAKNLKISVATLRRECHKLFGVSPIKRLQQRRMDAAKSLLLFTPLKIQQISDELGYGRMHEFSREFTTFYQVSPTQFRRDRAFTCGMNELRN